MKISDKKISEMRSYLSTISDMLRNRKIEMAYIEFKNLTKIFNEIIEKI